MIDSSFSEQHGSGELHEMMESKTVVLKNHEATIEGPVLSKEQVLDVLHVFPGIETEKLKLTYQVEVESSHPDTSNMPVYFTFKLDENEALSKFGSSNINLSYVVKGYYKQGFSNDTHVTVEYLDDSGDTEYAEIIAYWNPQTCKWQVDRPEIYQTANPYTNHEFLYTPEQAAKATKVFEIIKGGRDPRLMQELGIDETTAELFTCMGKEVLRKYTEFWLDKNILSDTSIPEEDKIMLMSYQNEECPSGVCPLHEEMQRLLARYLVQEDPELGYREEFLDEVGSLIAKGLDKYYQVYSIDIPLYDLLYQEFDSLRKEGESPLEVYLGRDGIYAYVGRRAQDIARRRQMGKIGRARLRSEGHILEIHPKYIVYPRFFRDELTPDQKRQYLTQEGIVAEVNPVFYDTGYVGTIPEDIMRVMAFPEEEIDKRIRLLSAQKEERRVKGVSADVRNEIVSKIEHNAKLEGSSEGLYLHRDQLRHIAKPTNPEEQFMYLMIRQAIVRHYWINEKQPKNKQTEIPVSLQVHIPEPSPIY